MMSEEKRDATVRNSESIRDSKKADLSIQDEQRAVYITRNEIITRMLADTCEICGSTEEVQAHHIRKLADLKKKWKGKPEKPKWVQKMIAMRRKTLFTCKKCHLAIHQGQYDGQKLTKISLESRVL